MASGHQKKEEAEIPFGVEDLLYYAKEVEEKQLHLDFGSLKKYFPINLVLSGIFKISQDLFGKAHMLYSIFLCNNLLYFLFMLSVLILCKIFILQA